MKRIVCLIHGFCQTETRMQRPMARVRVQFIFRQNVPGHAVARCYVKRYDQLLYHIMVSSG